MFEKEAEEYNQKVPFNPLNVEKEIRRAFQKGAEFGYNKANEWHDLRKNSNDLPKESGKYMVAIPNENGFIETDVARFGVSSGWEYFDTFVDEYGAEHIIAWKEYPTFYK